MGHLVKAPSIYKALPLSAQQNMDEDLARLSSLLPDDAPSLRIYEWVNPSLTYGYFADPERWLKVEALKSAGYDLGRRPTGGGILFHTHDLAFSVLIPKGHPSVSDNTLQNYHLINSVVKQAVERIIGMELTLLTPQEGNSSFCMAEPTVYDVMVGDKKIGGAAQRKTKLGLLHQGTICLKPFSVKEMGEFFLEPELVKKMEINSLPLPVEHAMLSRTLKEAFIEAFS